MIEERSRLILMFKMLGVGKIFLSEMRTSTKMDLTRHAALLVVSAIFLLPKSLEAKVFLWPEPRFISWTGGPAIILSTDFMINVPKHLELSSAARRYTKLIKKERWLPMSSSTLSKHLAANFESTETTLPSLEVSVVDLTADLQHGVDESYQILVHVSPTGAELVAQTVWGALRGLETFSQLVRLSFDAPSAPLIVDSEVVIHDAPLFPHRGVLLDVSRNFYPIRDIKRTVRALSYNKLNVLHLHITDSHSFPLELESEPELSRRGSYGPHFTYSKADITEIVRYARYYGVRVVPEIDTPGHAASWGGAYPEIVTCLNEFWLPTGVDWADRFASEPGAGQLNPLLPKTYDVVKNVITDVALLFTDDFYHAGGDELAPACWMDDALVQDYLGSSGNNTLGELLTKFINETRAYIDVYNKTVVYWEDVILDATVNVSASTLRPETTILQTWNNGPVNTKKITAAGYRTIVSSADSYYLDCGHGGFLGNDSQYDQNFNDDPANNFNYGGLGGSYCAPFKTWARIYDYDITVNLTEDETSLVLGGEVALWSEQADPTVLDARLWPRSSALAETLWSGNRDNIHAPVKRYADALERLNDWRFRLVHRGIRAEPLQPLWCIRNPRMCNLSF